MKYLFLLLILTSCKSINIDAVTKQVVTPGIKSGVMKIKYTAKFTVDVKSVIKSIKLENQNNENLEFYIIDLSNGKLIDRNKYIDKGHYFIEATIPYVNDSKKIVDMLVFTINTSSDKEIIIKKQTNLKENLLMK